MTTIEVVGQRPSTVPDSHIIFNAPRPLYGQEWTGDFVHGVFYASVDPADSEKIKRNEQLDGYRLNYISREEHAQRVNDWFDRFVADEYPGEDFSHITFDDRHDMYCAKMGKIVVLG